MMTPQFASTRPTWRNLNHADGEIPAGANRQTLSGKIPNGANRQSAIGDLAGKVLPCGKSFDDVERFRDQVSKTLHKPNESREAHSLVIPEFTYAIFPKKA